jgi:hypothetical protein
VCERELALAVILRYQLAVGRRPPIGRIRPGRLRRVVAARQGMSAGASSVASLAGYARTGHPAERQTPAPYPQAAAKVPADSRRGCFRHRARAQYLAAVSRSTGPGSCAAGTGISRPSSYETRSGRPGILGAEPQPASTSRQSSRRSLLAAQPNCQRNSTHLRLKHPRYRHGHCDGGVCALVRAAADIKPGGPPTATSRMVRERT